MDEPRPTTFLHGLLTKDQAANSWNTRTGLAALITVTALITWIFFVLAADAAKIPVWEESRNFRLGAHQFQMHPNPFDRQVQFFWLDFVIILMNQLKDWHHQMMLQRYQFLLASTNIISIKDYLTSVASSDLVGITYWFTWI